MIFDIFEIREIREGCPRPPIPLSGEVEGVMLMGKSQRNVIARNAVTKQTLEGNVSPGPGRRNPDRFFLALEGRGLIKVRVEKGSL